MQLRETHIPPWNIMKISFSQPIQTIHDLKILDEWHVGRCIPRSQQCRSARNTSRQPKRFRASQRVHGEGWDGWTARVPPIKGDSLWDSTIPLRVKSLLDVAKRINHESKVSWFFVLKTPVLLLCTSSSSFSCTPLVENLYGWTYITHRIHLSLGSEPSTWETKSG